MEKRDEMSEKLGVMVCGHGSRDAEAVAEFAQVAEGLRPLLPDYPVEYGYLEFAKPVIRDGLDKLRAQGVTRVLAVPGMLFAAGHAKNDIPSVLNTYAASHPGFWIDYGKELGIDPKMLAAAGARVRAALEQAEGEVVADRCLFSRRPEAEGGAIEVPGQKSAQQQGRDDGGDQDDGMDGRQKIGHWSVRFAVAPET